MNTYVNDSVSADGGSDAGSLNSEQSNRYGSVIESVGVLETPDQQINVHRRQFAGMKQQESPRRTLTESIYYSNTSSFQTPRSSMDLSRSFTDSALLSGQSPGNFMTQSTSSFQKAGVLASSFKQIKEESGLDSPPSTPTISVDQGSSTLGQRSFVSRTIIASAVSSSSLKNNEAYINEPRENSDLYGVNALVKNIGTVQSKNLLLNF